ncbi:MAG: class I SAM-dependent methyltransferase [Pseudomonadota bacterium]
MTDALPSTDNSEDFWEQHYAKVTQASGGRPSAALVRYVDGRHLGRALELGCARGDDAIWLAKQGWAVTGVDVAQAALEAARAAAKAAGVESRTTFERHDLGETFPDGSFDLVVAMFLQSPVQFGRAQALRKAAAAVASGGLLLIAAHGSRAPWSWADPDTVYPTARDELADLALEADEWREVFVGPIEREARGTDGQRATVIDTVVAMERY